MSPLHGIVNFCLNIMNSLTGEVKQGCILSLLLKKEQRKKHTSELWCWLRGMAARNPFTGVQSMQQLSLCTTYSTCMHTYVSLWDPFLRRSDLTSSPTHGRWMSQNPTRFLPEGSADPAQLDGVVEQQWSKHHFSVEFSCSFVWLCMTWELRAKPYCSRRDLMVPVSLWRINRADKLIGWQMSF